MAVAGETEAVSAGLTETVAAPDVAVPPLGSVTSTDTENCPGAPALTVQVRSEGPQPVDAVSLGYDQAYVFPPGPPVVARVKEAEVTPSASMDAPDGETEAVSARLTTTLTALEDDWKPETPESETTAQ